MSTRSGTTRRAVVVLAVATTAALSACGATPDESADAASGQTCDSPRDDASVLPPGLVDGSRLFATAYRSYILRVTCGRLEIVEPTGFDTCYFLDGDQVRNYPC